MAPLLISLVSDRSVSLHLCHPDRPSHPIPLSLIQCTFYSNSACWQVFFFLSRCTYPRESRGEERPSTFPLTACSDNLAPFRGTRFGACEVSPTRHLSRGQVRFTRTRTFCRFGDVTARRHLCREHPKGPTTPDPRSPLSSEEFEIARHRPFQRLGEAAGMWRTNYRRSFCVSPCNLRVKWKTRVSRLKKTWFHNIYSRVIYGKNCAKNTYCKIYLFVL